MLSLYTKIISFLAKSWYQKTCGALKLTRYSHTWANYHLWITTTCLQRPLFWYHNFNFHNVKLPLNNDHLLTMATNLGSRGWSLYTSLTVYNFEKITIWHTLKDRQRRLLNTKGIPKQLGLLSFEDLPQG